VPIFVDRGVSRGQRGGSPTVVNLGFLDRYNIPIYKAILKPICTYVIQQWGTASTSNTEILERFQPKVLRTIVDAPWYVPNAVIRRDLVTRTVKEEIRHYSSQYSARLSVHPDEIAVNLMAQPDNRRLRRYIPNNLPNRF
jgi:hypothetical protein